MNAGLVLVILTVAFFLAQVLLTRRPAVNSRYGVAVDPGTLVKYVIPLAVSVVLVGASLYLILSPRFGTQTLKFAYGAVGIIAGFWLRTIG